MSGSTPRPIPSHASQNFLEEPGCVVDRLGEDVARGAVSLVLDDHEAAVAIECQQVERPRRGRRLAVDDQYVDAEKLGG